MALIRCHECKGPVSTDVAACSKCGAKPIPPPPKPKTRPVFVVLAWGLAGLGAAGIVFPLIDRYNKAPEEANEAAAANVKAPATPTSVAEVSSDTAQPGIPTSGLYREYVADPLTADAKYEGRRITVTGSVIAAQFADAGVGHIRMISADGGGSGTGDSVLLCFTESCESMRRPTVTDDQFKTVKVGSFVSATCTAEPVKLDRPRNPNFVGVSLSKCSMP